MSSGFAKCSLGAQSSKLKIDDLKHGFTLKSIFEEKYG